MNWEVRGGRFIPVEEVQERGLQYQRPLPPKTVAGLFGLVWFGFQLLLGPLLPPAAPRPSPFVFRQLQARLPFGNQAGSSVWLTNGRGWGAGAHASQ